MLTRYGQHQFAGRVYHELRTALHSFSAWGLNATPFQIMVQGVFGSGAAVETFQLRSHHTLARLQISSRQQEHVRNLAGLPCEAQQQR